MNVSKFLQELKPNVTKWARQYIHPAFEWQNGYGAFTVSDSQVEIVKQYIRNQEQHHSRYNFRDEFETLLRKSGIDYDPDFLWK